VHGRRTAQYLRVPAHIADAYYPGWDMRASYFGRGRVRRHGQCLTPVQDLDHPAIEGPDLNSQRIEVSDMGKNRHLPSPPRSDTNVYSSVSRPGVDVSPSRRLGRTEVAPYESLEHGVPSVRHDAAVRWMRQVLWFWILPIAKIQYDGENSEIRGR
jgi:hypothetical protein